MLGYLCFLFFFVYICIRIMHNEFMEIERVRFQVEVPRDEMRFLGKVIQQMRKAKGVTQEELGKKVGLSKSGISKIEKGTTKISFEDAVLLMDAMGEKLNVYFEKPAGRAEPKCLGFIMTAVIWYAKSKTMPLADAYRYMLAHKAIRFLKENYVYEQTLPKQTIIGDIEKVCRRSVQAEGLSGSARSSSSTDASR